ncbi:DUF6895 family protein [Streptomyces sp. BG6AG]|uniref:DUF6895 family protein n=1 Tax=Streptomyces sp. BG6AG TaxID=3394376 RepID=UPI0039EF88CC
MDPLRTPSGEAGVRILARAQSPLGAIPGKSVAWRGPATAAAGEYFRWAYHATLVTALSMLIVTAGWTGGLLPAGGAGGAGAESAGCAEGAR